MELGADLGVGMQVLEDALCNWQKSPDRFTPSRMSSLFDPGALPARGGRVPGGTQGSGRGRSRCGSCRGPPCAFTGRALHLLNFSSMIQRAEALEEGRDSEDVLLPQLLLRGGQMTSVLDSAVSEMVLCLPDLEHSDESLRGVVVAQ